MSSWAHVTAHDKEAFFSLLDEYFASRPHLLGQNQGPSVAAVGKALHTVASHAPPAPPSTNRSGSPASTANQTAASSSNFDSIKKLGSDPRIAAASGKVGALAGRFKSPSSASTTQAQADAAAAKPPAPPAPTSRGVPSSHAGSSTLPAGLSSSKNFFGGMVSQKEKDAMRNKPTGILASAAPASRSNFAPPPTRRTGTLPSAAPAAPAEDEDDADGEYVEAMYDYQGTDAEDLSFRERQIILIAERVSDDWAKGSVDGGPVGMFPLSYTRPV